jgi:sec-independent protein translocase protein TatB
MFDIGFSEFAIIGIVALVVLGPEKLPKVAKVAGQTIGKLQRYVAQVKADINREVEAAELGKIKREMEDAAKSVKSEFDAQVNAVEDVARDANQQLQTATTSQEPAPTVGQPSFEDDWARLSHDAHDSQGVTHTSDSHRPINEER